MIAVGGRIAISGVGLLYDNVDLDEVPLYLSTYPHP